MSWSTFAQELAPAVEAERPESIALAAKRAAGMMEELNLADADKAARVRRHIENFIVTLKNLHEGENPPAGEAKREALLAARKALYDGLDVEGLADEQKLVIKNGLSANHFRINYDAFLFLVPTLTDEEKKYIHDQLAEVCDEAILLNSGTAKGAMFEKRRGRINVYLSQRGYDLKKLSEVRNAKLRERSATRPATTQSTSP